MFLVFLPGNIFETMDCCNSKLALNSHFGFRIKFDAIRSTSKNVVCARPAKPVLPNRCYHTINESHSLNSVVVVVKFSVVRMNRQYDGCILSV